MKKTLFLLLVLLAGVLQSRGADVIISEFMASNTRTLADEDGQYSDWIEVFNRGAEPVDLGGWFLTDNENNLVKWQFPSTNLAPGAFLVVFASGNDRRVAGAPLHTNFKLDAGGEFLALVQPDGVTLVTAFAPTYPQQYADIPYGWLMSGNTTPLLTSGAVARVLVPSGNIGSAWRSTNFNDAGWPAGTTGVGYDNTTNYPPVIGLDLRSAMSNINASAYLRLPFNVETNPTTFQGLMLRLRYDDGFVAWLNGTEVVRRNAPTTLAWNSVATGTHGTPSPATLAETFEGAVANYSLSLYAAVPAAAVQAAGAGSTGKFLRLLYDGVNNNANAIAFPLVSPGAYGRIAAQFDFRVSDAQGEPADGFNFLLIPTAVYGTNGPGLNVVAQSYPAEEPSYPGVFAIGFDVYPHNEPRNDVSAHWNGREYVNVTIPRATLDLVAGVFHRANIFLEQTTGGSLVSVTVTPSVNATPGDPYTVVTNFFISGLNPYECRVELGGRTGGADLSLDLDNINVQFNPTQGAVPFEDFDISAFRGLLQQGSNVLAIQGLNVAANDRDFLILPELAGAAYTVGASANYIYPPTPGSWNNVTAAGKLGPVSFFPPAGVYASNTLAVTMASSSSSGQIRYTLDGSAPTASSPLYTGPVVLAANGVVRACAFETNLIPAEVAAANYVLLDSSLTNFASRLPLVVIDTLGDPGGGRQDPGLRRLHRHQRSLGADWSDQPAGPHGAGGGGIPRAEFPGVSQEVHECRDR